MTRLATSTAFIGAASAAHAGSPVAIPANMLPQGGHFVAGTGSIGTQGLTETITQSSQRGIIDFSSFSIGKSGTVKINNGMGATLDRVTGGSLSQIMGTLSATGSVYLVNPQGVVIGKSGVVTTGGSFVASSLDISNQNFMAGSTLRFEGGASEGVVKNLGSISSSGGDVFLIARSVVNAGSINTPNGTVGLGAGQEVLLKDMSVGGGRMSVRLGKGDVTNKGAITAAQAELKAAGGNVYALAGNHSGMIRATGSATRGGHVWLTAGGSVFASGPITASNRDGSGGRVTIKAAKVAKVTGRIDASAATPSARSRSSGNPAEMSGEAGGTVIVTGHDVTLGATAVIDASGTGDGGTVLIGGDRQGGAVASQDFAKHTIANAQTTIVEAGAEILADGGVGGGSGTGGNVVVWSDKHTVFAGSISVTGGAQGGNGGFVETSSHGVLDFTGTADRLAPKGKAGTLLLDPTDLDIVTGGAGGSSIPTTGGTISATSGNPTDSTLTTTDLQNALAAGNVTLQTSGTLGPSTGLGNINVDASFSWSSANSLTLSAFNSVTFASGVAATNTGGGSVTLRADNTGIGAVSGAGLNAGFGQVTFAGGQQIKLSGGTTKGNINILYDGFSAGAFAAPINYAGNVSLAAGGKLTPFELVNNLTQLQAISGALSKNYALGTSFSASGTPFTALGAGAPVTKFTGIFDGEGQTITGLTLSPGAAKSLNLGLFAEIGAAGVVRNVTLANVSITGTATGDSNIGAIAGQNLGTISNVSASGTISLGATASNIGGLVGVNTATVTGATGSVNLTLGNGGAQIGGLAGFNNGGTISSSLASGSVSVTGSVANIGGLVGQNTNGKIVSSTATGAVVATGAVSAGGGLAGRNDDTFVNALGTITPASLTVSAVTDSRVYNGTTSSSGTPTIGGTVFGTDAASFGQAFQSKDVLGHDDSTLVASGSFVDALGTITPAALTITAVSDSRIYNGTTSSSGTPTFGTLFGNDTASFTQAFLSKDVLGANASTLRASGSVRDGNGGKDYSITFVDALGTITPAQLTVSAVTDSRVYNGTTSSSGVVHVSGLQTGDTASGFTQSFLSRNVLGTNGSTLSVNQSSGVLSDGNGGGNYTVTFTTAQGTITPFTLTASVIANNKVYDASTGATLSSEALNGVFAGDVVTLSGGLASFDTKNVGTGKTVTVSGLTLGGGDAGNYVLASTSLMMTASITPATLKISAVSDSKVFDGTMGSTASALVVGLKGNDGVSGLAERFDSINAGARNLSFGPLSVNDGNGGGNYILNIVNATAPGTITPAPLTVTANNVMAAQGGPQPAFTASFSGFPTDLGASALTGTLTFTVSEIPGMPGSFAILPGGLSSSNFTIAFVPGTLVLTGGSPVSSSNTTNAANGTSSDLQSVATAGEDITSVSAAKLANFALPPVPFAIDDGDFARSNGLFMGDPIVNSVLGSTNGALATETGNLVVPSLDENANPIGRLIGFNSTFIETCRARASLCR